MAWNTESLTHNKDVAVQAGTGPIRVFFRVISGASTLDLQTSSDGFDNDIVTLISAQTSGSVEVVNDGAAKTVLGHKIRAVLSDPSAEVEIKVSRDL